MENIIVIDICVTNTFNVNFFEDLNNVNDKQGAGNFYAFIINVGGRLFNYGYEILDSHQSNRPDSLSYYLLAAKKNDLENDNIKVIVNIRLSDHPFNDNATDIKKQLARIIYYDNEAQKYKLPKDKETQDWEFYNIIVAGHSNKDYRKALNQLEQNLDEIEDIYYGEE